MNKVMGLAFAGLVGMVCADVAMATTAQCVNCSDTQMDNMARTLGASSSAHIVWDPATGNIKRYLNYCGSAPNSVEPKAKAVGTKAGCTLQTDELQVDGDLASVAAAMGEVWRQTGGTFKADFTASISGIAYPSYYPGKPTAHDFLMDYGLRADILRLVNTPEIFSTPGTGGSGTLGNALAAIAAHVDAYLAMKQGVYLTIDVEFHDGSKVSIKLTLGENPEYVPNSAYDSTGHGRPDPAVFQQSYSGRWYFGPGDSHDMAEFIEYMRSLGITITSGSGLGDGQINCIWTATTNTTTCFVPR